MTVSDFFNTGIRRGAHVQVSVYNVIKKQQVAVGVKLRPGKPRKHYERTVPRIAKGKLKHDRRTFHW